MNQSVYDPNWKQKFLISGSLIGAFVGLATAYLLARAAEEDGEGPPQVDTADAIRVVMGVVGTMRGVAALGKRA
jgi:hypothetical protein